MTRLSATEPFIHPDCDITDSTFGAYVEIGRGSRLNNATFGDYSYCDRYADIANARVGKLAASIRMAIVQKPYGNRPPQPEVNAPRGAVC